MKDTIHIAETRKAAAMSHGATTLTFRKIEDSDVAELARFMSAYPSKSCDFSIGGVLMWVSYFNYEFCIVSDTLFMKSDSNSTGRVLFYYPVGAMASEEALRLISEYCVSRKISARIIMPVTVEAGCEPPSYRGAMEYMPWMEYLYDIESFKSFPGKKMEKKRNHLNYFMKNYEYEVERIDASNIAELVEFTRRFESSHADADVAVYENEQTIAALRNYDSYPYCGLLVRIGGKTAGYTFGEVIGDTCFVHVEKGDTGYRGIYQALASEFSRMVGSAYPGVRFLNREEDMGDVSLRQSKLSYHPCSVVCKYIFSIEHLMLLAEEQTLERA